VKGFSCTEPNDSSGAQEMILRAGNRNVKNGNRQKTQHNYTLY